MRIFCDNEFYQDGGAPDVDDICWHAGRWHRYTVAATWADHNQPETPAVMLSDLDLSPLQKFMGGLDCLGRRLWRNLVYVPDYDFDWVPPAPSPEKSPQEKALEDFIAKRKAKREGAGVFGGIGRDAEDAEMRRAIKEEADGRMLDRAMRRLGFHEQDIHTRLMPYRREV